jgi:vacuole morphology and inheritance protein 14
MFPSTTQLGGTLAHTSGNDRQPGSASASSVVSNFERPNRLKAREDSNVRWVELLEKFRTMQERARKQSRGALIAGEDVGSPPPVPDKEQGVPIGDQTRGGPPRVIPRAGTPTGGLPVGQVPAPQKGPTRSKVGLGLGRFGGGGGKKDKKK